MTLILYNPLAQAWRIWVKGPGLGESNVAVLLGENKEIPKDFRRAVFWVSVHQMGKKGLDLLPLLTLWLFSVSTQADSAEGLV